MKEEVRQSVENYKQVILGSAPMVEKWHNGEATPKQVLAVVRGYIESYPTTFLSNVDGLAAWILSWNEDGRKGLPFMSSGSNWTAWFDVDFLECFDELGDDYEEVASSLEDAFRPVWLSKR